MSKTDIHSGQRWSAELAGELELANFGLICVTSDNKDKTWLLFEAGSLAKSLSGRVVPLLFDMHLADLSGPLAQFQAEEMSQDSMRSVVTSIHRCLPESRLSPEVVFRSFDKFWPDLEHGLEALRNEDGVTDVRSARPDRDILEEILVAIRRIESAESDFRSGAGARASQVRILWLEDLVRAAEYFVDDLSYREYQLQLHRSTETDTYKRIQAEYELATKADDYLRLLLSTKGSPESGAS